MMMECPRCGFTQPKDQYCAKCGLDVDAFAAKPKPIFVRIAQNPNVHLSLIGALIVVIAGYIIFSQGSIVHRQVTRLLGNPISSRDAATGPASKLPPPPPPPSQKAAAPVETVSETTGIPADSAQAAAAADAAAAKAAPEATKFEISSWEVSRDALSTALANAEKVGEGSGGKVYLLKDASKIVDTLSAAGHRVSAARTMPIENGAQLAIETPPTTPEAFQFGLYFQVSKSEGSKDVNLKWESSMVLPPPEPPAAAAVAGAAADPNAAATAPAARQPSVRALVEAQLNGSATPPPQSAVLLVYDPGTRAIRDDSLAKAGDGPWAIFGSYHFRSGATDWVMLVQPK